MNELLQTMKEKNEFLYHQVRLRLLFNQDNLKELLSHSAITTERITDFIIPEDTYESFLEYIEFVNDEF
jgi:hypothetical protein